MKPIRCGVTSSSLNLRNTPVHLDIYFPKNDSIPREPLPAEDQERLRHMRNRELAFLRRTRDNIRTSGQMRVILGEILRESPLTMTTDIYRGYDLPKSSVISACRWMADRGLVNYEIHAIDERCGLDGKSTRTIRRKHWYLTDDGQRWLDEQLKEKEDDL